MSKTLVLLLAGLVVIAAAYVVLFPDPGDAMPPIVDPVCETGYVLVGEGCMPVDEACELQGDSYTYDEASGECVNTADSQTMDVKIALLDTTGEGTGTPRGCDTVSMVSRTVPYSTGVLDASLKALFAVPEGTQPSSQYNFIARTSATLQYQKVTISDGVAHIYLAGELTGLAGVCDDPRAASQITETALQFPTVEDVQLYLNGEATTLIPSQ